MRHILLAAIVSTLASGPAVAEVTGMAGVPAGDVLSIDGKLYRLFGIDAVERLQPCYVDGKVWACGPVALRQLEIFVANGPVTCRETGESAADLGAWAVCTVTGGDLGEAMVRTGMALAYRPQSDKYVEAEEEAKAEGAGIWESNFVEPWVYRADMRLIEERIAERLRNTPVDPGKLDAVRLQVERALTEGNGGIKVFQGFQIVRADAELPQREYTATAVEKGILTEPAMAQEPEDWRGLVTQIAQEHAVQFVWTDLQERTVSAIHAPDAATYLRAVVKRAAPMIQSGRQPVLLVRSLEDPLWIKDWFGTIGENPAGLQISRKDGIETASYLGTIDGIDVYVGDPEEGESLLFPIDLLKAVKYGTNTEGRVVTVEFEETTEQEPGKLIFRFSQEVEWMGGDVSLLRYPPVPVEDAYE